MYICVKSLIHVLMYVVLIYNCVHVYLYLHMSFQIGVRKYLIQDICICVPRVIDKMSANTCTWLIDQGFGNCTFDIIIDLLWWVYWLLLGFLVQQLRLLIKWRNLTFHPSKIKRRERTRWLIEISRKKFSQA